VLDELFGVSPQIRTQGVYTGPNLFSTTFRGDMGAAFEPLPYRRGQRAAFVQGRRFLPRHFAAISQVAGSNVGPALTWPGGLVVFETPGFALHSRVSVCAFIGVP
jgi:hypothetical protein